MTEPNEHGQSNSNGDSINTSLTSTATKKSVVDDFFSALFANNNSNNTSTPTDTSEVSPPAPPAAPVIDAPIKQEPGIKYNTSHYHDKDNVAQDDDNRNNNSINNNRKRERVLDEFDEYSLLSSKRRNSNGSKRNNKSASTGNIELDEQLERQILSKRDIDWSNVKPESRMLVRQLPKFIDKQAVMSHFSKYGEVLEVVQKTPFGFVHFENPEACAQAVQAENGQSFHGIILDLEICKRKPFFARAAEKEQRRESHKHNFENKHRRDSSPAPPIPQQQNNQKVNRPDQRNNNHNGRYPQTSPIRGNNYTNNSNGYSNDRRRNDLPNNRQHNGYRPDYSDTTNNNNSNNGYYRGDNRSNSPYPRYGNDNSTFRQQQGDNRYNGNNFVNNNYNYTGQAPTATEASQYRDEHPRNNYKYEPSSSRYNDNNSYNSSLRYNNYNQPNSNNGVTPANFPTHSSIASTSNNIIPRRQGSEIPMVQIISWDNVAYAYTDYIERILSTNGIRCASINLTYSQMTREQIVKQMILEGVKAIIMIDHQNEIKNKIYLQVFAPAEYGQAVRFDEYDSVTALEAVNIYYRMYPSSTTISQPTISPPPSQPLHQQQQQQPATTAPVDMNTLASLYSMLQQQQQQQQQQAQPAVTVSPPTNNINQATIPQLLATLVNGLSMNNQQSAIPTAVSPPPLANHYPQPQVTTTQDNNIAALISTAASGNPALAQLLAQMTTSVGANNNGNELHK